MRFVFFFFFNDTATTEIYTLSLHDALPIFGGHVLDPPARRRAEERVQVAELHGDPAAPAREAGERRVGHAEGEAGLRSEEHTSELQSRQYLVCRLLLEKKKKKKI